MSAARVKPGDLITVTGMGGAYDRKVLRVVEVHDNGSITVERPDWDGDSDAYATIHPSEVQVHIVAPGSQVPFLVVAPEREQ